MGCCISKTPAARPRPPLRPSAIPPRLPPPLSYAGPSPPQPLSRPIPSPLPLEEESVKEIVISEISPLPPPPTAPVPDSLPPVPAARPQPSPPRPPKLLSPLPQARQLPPTPRKQRDAAETDILISKLEQAADVVSEYSDMYTMSGSLSMSTTATTGTAATLNDSEVTSKAHRSAARTPPKRVPRKRPPVAGRDERSDRGAGTGPHTRRLQQPSPDRGRRGTSQGRDPGGVRRNAGGQARRDTRRRSSSPAQGRAGDGKRTVSAGYNRSSSLSGPGSGNGPSTQRSRMNPDPDRNDGVRGGRGKDNENDSAASESLDNPHVSLECFIFL